MAKKFDEDFEDDDEEEFDEESEDEEEEMDGDSDDDEAPKRGRGRPPKNSPQLSKQEIDPKKWQIIHQPEIWAVINPKTKKVVAEGSSKEDLILQLNVIAAQKSVEAAKLVE